ncbi:MAG: TonB-dependent receptor, partial [Pseudomonadota bacterium]|nr:TonB-dependent receptor [Pseudomonadota bacterium]
MRAIQVTRLTLLLGVALLPLARADAQTSAGPAPAADTRQPQQSQAPGTSGPEQPVGAQANNDLDTIVVTGQTTRNRALITSSADITFATAADIDRRAPRSTADLLELVPGIFVEGTAGEVSNNYSVRGLQGGGQRFIQLEEDGLPVVYGGGGGDEFFSNDITIDRLEAVKGGSSGVLTVNGAGATINFISRLPNFEKPEAIARFTAYNYGLKRGDFYLSAPINDHLAVNFGGYASSSPGVRSNPFNYSTYRIKGAIEYKTDDGTFIRVTGKIGDQQTAYYADQPYTARNGSIGSVPGFDGQFGNIGGNAFGQVQIPVSTFIEPSGFRTFRLSRGVEAITKELRIDADKPIGDNINIFAKAKYLALKWDFNGLFPGSSTGNSGLAPAVQYLTQGAGGPIDNLLVQGRSAFPNTISFGIKDLTNGQIIGANNTAALNALNGNGLLQQTTLNHAQQSGHEFGSNFGGRWEYDGSGFKNSLTAGMMVFSAHRYQNQSATGFELNDVRNNSHIYDVVGLNGAGAVTGTLTDNGLVSYGNWGQGQSEDSNTSISVYANDELQIGKLRVDGGIRYESNNASHRDGNTATAADAAIAANRIVPVNIDPKTGIPGDYQQLVQPGVVGLGNTQTTYGGVLVQTVGPTFDGTYTSRQKTQHRVAYTVGANYLFTPNLSVYGRYADGFQMQGTDPFAVIKLYEGGVRYSGHGLNAQVTYFHTDFNDQFFSIQDPADQTKFQDLLSNYNVNGVEIDFTFQPVKYFAIDFTSVFQDPKLNNFRQRSRTTGANGAL